MCLALMEGREAKLDEFKIFTQTPRGSKSITPPTPGTPLSRHSEMGTVIAEAVGLGRKSGLSLVEDGDGEDDWLSNDGAGKSY
jgi:hypothetical protein